MSHFRLIAYVLTGFGIGATGSWLANSNNNNKNLYLKLKRYDLDTKDINQKEESYLEQHQYKKFGSDKLNELIYFIPKDDVDSEGNIETKYYGNNIKIHMRNEKN